MKRTLSLVLLIVGLAGCKHVVTRSDAHRPTLADNTPDFDRYVERRTESLYASGAFKNRSEAETKARSEATNRYGERAPDYGTSWSWSSSTQGDRALTLADYDKMTKDAKTR